MKKVLFTALMCLGSASFNVNARFLEDVASFFGFEKADTMETRHVKPRPPRGW